MGLAIGVGLVGRCPDDPEGEEWGRRQLREINRVLHANGLAEFDETPIIPEPEPGYALGSFPYGWLHYLRRALAYARDDPSKLRPVEKGDDPAADPLIDDELFIKMDSHVICHSDCEGFYVPIDFDKVLYDDKDTLAGGMLGSSQRAMAELVQVASLIDIPLTRGKVTAAAVKLIADGAEKSHPYWVERQVWLAFYEAVRDSIAHGRVVVFQ